MSTELEQKIERLEIQFGIKSPLKQTSIESESEAPYFLQLSGYDKIKSASTKQVERESSTPYFVELGGLY